MSYYLEFTDKAIDDIDFHKKSGNKSAQKKLLALLVELTEHPFTGIEKPEPLKHEFSGLWSRRISREHRLVYEVSDNIVFILSALGHYE